MMKYLTILVFFLSMTISAQETKVGTVDVDFILSKMPEIKDVQEQVQIFSTGLEGELQTKMQVLQSEVQKYQQEEVSLTINQRKSRQDSLMSMENNINKFQQNGNQLILAKQEELMQPLYTKVGEALEKVAGADGYTQVLLRNNDVVYVDNRFDLTIAVLKELGIEVKEEE